MDPRLWSAVAGVSAFMLPSLRFDLGPWLGRLNDPSEQHSIAVELYGAAGSDWHVASSLHLWRARGLRGRRVRAVEGPTVALSPGARAPVAARCRASGRGADADVAVAADCVAEVAARRLEATSMLDIGGERYEAAVRYDLAQYSDWTPFNNTSGFAAWTQLTGPFEAAWSLRRAGGVSWENGGKTGSSNKQSGGAAAAAAGSSQKGSSGRGGKRSHHGSGGNSGGVAAGRGRQLSERQQQQQYDTAAVVTQHSARYEWLHAGGIAPRHPFVFSYNTTLLAPTVFAPLPLSPPPPTTTTPSAAARSACGGGGGGGGVGRRQQRQEQQQQEPVVVAGSVRHYQAAVMVEVYSPTSQLRPTKEATHTARLESSLRARGAARACVAWRAAAAFGAPRPERSELATDAACLVEA